MSWLISKVFGGGAAAAPAASTPAAAAAPAAAPASPVPAQAAAASSGLPGVAVSPPKPTPAAAAAAAAATPAKGGKVTSLDGKELAQWRKDTAVDVKAVTAKVKGEVVADALGALYLMNAAGHLEIRAPRSLALLVREAKHQYAFQIYDHTGKLRLTQPVTSAMQMNYDKFNHSLIWILVLDNRTHAWSLEFENFDAEKNFKMQLAIALMEHARREDFAKAVGKNDKDWVIGGQDSAAAMEDDYDSDGAPVGAASPDGKQKDDGAFKDFEYNESRYKPSRFSIEETSAAAVAAAAASPGRRAPAKAQESDEEDDDDDAGSDQEDAPAPKTKTPIRVGGPAKAKSEAAFAATPTGPERNSNLAVGMANNRTFVMRGSKIGVFKHDDEDQLEYVNKIPQIKDLSGELFTPSKAMLHERDSKMLLLDPTKEDTVFCMDLERGQVIEEWQVDDEAKIRNFAPTTKYSQLTNERQVLGVNRNSVFTMDPRIGGKNKRALNQSYSKPPQLSCINASGDGYVATGDLKGEIRMFSDVSKKAKTLLPGLGDPVIGIDVTDDGNYILATTAQYLLLIPTLLPNGKTGFQAGMGAHKPTPIKLQLSPVDIVKHDIKSVAFTAAHFNTGKDISEEWIVTASGPFIITWNLKRVLKGFTKEYKIKRVYQDVVADTFRYGKEDQVVVTTADDAYVEKRTITMRQKGAAAAAAAAGAGAGAGAAAAKAATPKK